MMVDQEPMLQSIKLTPEQQSAMDSRACGLAVALTLFALLLYLASFVHFIG